ncbi:hypothetical protein IQ07DRAFT_8753, partial [Pyrenochaeta sp. DS3sAY3a]
PKHLHFFLRFLQYCSFRFTSLTFAVYVQTAILVLVLSYPANSIKYLLPLKMASNMSPSRNSSDHHTVTYTADTIGHGTYGRRVSCRLKLNHVAGHLSSSSITPPSSFLPNPIEQAEASSPAKQPSPVPCLEDIEYLCVVCKVLCKNMDEVAEHLHSHELVFTKPGDVFLCRFCTCLFPNCASSFKGTTSAPCSKTSTLSETLSREWMGLMGCHTILAPLAASMDYDLRSSISSPTRASLG